MERRTSLSSSPGHPRAPAQDILGLERGAGFGPASFSELKTVLETDRPIILYESETLYLLYNLIPYIIIGRLKEEGLRIESVLLAARDAKMPVPVFRGFLEQNEFRIIEL